MLNGLIKGMPNADAIGGAKSAFDALPGVVDALARIPAILRDLPPAPVVLGAFSRVVADAIAKELDRKGPSESFVAIAREHGCTDADALYRAFVAEVRA